MMRLAERAGTLTPVSVTGVRLPDTETGGRRAVHLTEVGELPADRQSAA